MSSFNPRMLLWSTLLLFGILGGHHVDARPKRDDGPLLSTRQEGRDNSTRPCGAVFDEVDRLLAIREFPAFTASDVYACLVTIPFAKDVGLRFIEYYNTTLQFQSTLAYLRYPTAEYQQPAIDVVAELGRVKDKVLAGGYQRQLDFEYDIHSIVLAMHDSHVTLTFGITAAFTFASEFDIVSASLDGRALPKPYLKSDILIAQADGFKRQPSPIATINGFPAVEYLTRFAKQHAFGNLEDHADWNDLFEHPANDIQGFYGTWGGQITFYPGNGPDDGLIIKLENGTTHEGIWLALLNSLHNPGPIETAGDFYNYFVLGLEPAAMPVIGDDDGGPGPSFGDLKPIEVPKDEEVWAFESDGAYPKADIAQENLQIAGGGVVTGYFQDDIGILSLPSFFQYPDEAKDFSAAVQDFITEAGKRKIKKIIIDIQQNRGGTVALAFDTFRRFFPDEPQGLPWSWAGSRRRSHPMGDLLGTEITDWWNSLDEDDFDKWDEAANEFVVSTKINALTNKTFSNWREYSPSRSANYRGDRWSNVERYDLFNDQFLYSAFSSENVEDDPYGYGHNPIETSQIWTADQIVLLTDGLCSSACSIFAGMMAQAGVRSVVAGGRPETGPMQAVAGSRGARAYSSGILDWAMKFVQETLAPNTTLLPVIPDDFETRDTGILVHNAGFNLRDEILKPDFDRDPDDQHLPRQFQYEAAHCRIFYTVRSIYNMTRLWSDVAKVAWTDQGLCVQGSTGYADLPGQPAISLPPPRLPIHNSASVVDTARGGAGEDDNAPPTFNEGDIVAGQGLVKQEALKLCEAGACPRNFRCEEVPVKCGTGQRPTQSTAEYCLPLCRPSNSADNSGTCGKYSADLKLNGALSCRLKFAVEINKAKGGRQDYVGCCQPRSGIKAKDFCVRSTTPTTTASRSPSSSTSPAVAAATP
ncbi:hypothetical protein QBC42DRAFT_200254 [Cladorrhinum samala]|uniref:Tail specific protease domain-containing protein n=1 Tax=Cladorrhinum samala TaxID=585594 RepID=A0AAV9HQ48_9PEZI|nr:hypothetical protein QBC42DRAFT_200254 [Cladorrhinum samala]